MADKQKILLIKTGAFGDVVLCSFSINMVSKTYPDADVYLLTSEQYSEIHRDCGLLKGILALPNTRNIFHFIHFTKKLRRMKFQKIFDIQGNLKTNFYAFAFGGMKRIGLYKKILGKIFLTDAIKKKSGVNPVESQMLFWKKATGSQTGGCLQLWISGEKRKNFSVFLEKYKLSPKQYVVFHTSASNEWETKKWIHKYWVGLGDFFSKENLPVVLIGDRNSVELNGKIGKLINGKVVNLAGKTDFFELALVIQHAKLCITTDSGPMHVASAVGTETVAIFGPTNPYWHAAPGIKIVRSQIDCSPCYKKRCSHHSCMKSITPKKIIAVIENQ